MVIVQSSKCIFFHTPRTGGNALSKELGDIQIDNPLQHWHAWKAKKWIFQDTWNQYWKFSFVRNPWERYVSLYEHLYNGPTAPRPIMFGAAAPRYKFDEWLYLCSNKFIESEACGVPQTRWTFENDATFRFEERDAALPVIAERTGFDMKNLKTNSSNHGSYVDYYKKKSTIELVKSIDIDTIKRFGYKFGD